MAESSDVDDETVEGQLTPESIKVIAESVGIANLNHEAINLLMDEGTYRLKQITQVLNDWSFVYVMIAQIDKEITAVSDIVCSLAL